MASLWKCIFGPRLHRIHRRSPVTEGKAHEANLIENGGDQVIRWIRLCYSISYYTSPILATFLYRRGYFTVDGGLSMVRFLSNIGVLFVGAFILRGIGRYRNEDYITFLTVLVNATRDYTPENKRKLSFYDFDFYAWPIDFDIKEVTQGEDKPRICPSKPRSKTLKTLPCSILSYFVAHTFGRRMVYPGATALVQTLIGPALLQGRTKLVEEERGVRSKLLTDDGNEIDTMFVDRRGVNADGNHQTLVICCEGNSGFYEVGCMCTPLESGYSVLGWNHPGFGGSTGAPLPKQEENAIDVVMQYAIHQLHFHVENIVLFAWSIGGYTACWAAANYPDIKHVILDATFDDLVPLAVARMPQSWRSLVITTIRNHMNLNNAELLNRYPGPIQLIRRYRDEMICTQEPPDPATNRGNDLLIKVLQHRFPKLVDETTIPILRDMLAGSEAKAGLHSLYEVDDELITLALRSYVEEYSPSYPMQIGEDLDENTKIQYTLFLASHYMKDFDSTHCTPLPTRLFLKPWDIQQDPGLKFEI
ncbi:phosphatidylserine lipase ABHD16A-like [Lineus longissimus]|uniref:phosphatidylserine lipase ABHD16A-like n=1 Tax=Lineus longissimus TaxID=88925 RepID=UPI002B4CD623